MIKIKKKEKKVIFNHFYHLKHDAKRSYILSPDRNISNLRVSTGIISKIHPVYAMIFSFFSSPISVHEAISEVSYFLDMSEKEVEDFIVGLIGNDEFYHCISKDGWTNVFPPNILIEADDARIEEVHYSPMQFAYKELDFKHERLYTSPIGILFVVNNTCSVDCCYCYSNKEKKSDLLPFDKVKTIIKNAYEANVFEITITGGEVFLYKYWKELVEELLKYKYRTSLISTKLPIQESDIDIIKKYDIHIQISLDSLNSKELKKILGVNSDYVDKIKQTILLLEQKGVIYQISTVITNHNESLETLMNLYEFLSQFSNLRRWEIRTAFRSLYSRETFDQFKISKETEQKIAKWVQAKQSLNKMYIEWSPSFDESRYFNCEGGSRHFVGARCSATYSQMVLLPDGKVTICEQIYWNPHFILGDLSTQSIEEVWNSPRSLALTYLQKNDFQDSSVCKQCHIFEDCYLYHNKCYIDVIKAYGDKNWDYPDPRCKYAPPFIHDLLIR